MLSWSFFTEQDTGEKFTCALCGKTLEEAFFLEAEDDDCWKILERRFGDISNWVVGECCFGEYALDPDTFIEVLQSKDVTEREEALAGLVVLLDCLGSTR